MFGGGCGGPSALTEAEKQEAFDFVMEALTKKYHLALGDDVKPFNKSFGDARKKVLADLKAAIAEVLDHDRCEGF